MITKKSAQKRGELEQEGLLTKCSFSFQNYYNPDYLGLQTLKVLNENFLKSGASFQAANKELLVFFFILEGKMEYEDEKRNRLTFLPGDGVMIHSGLGFSYHLKNISLEDAHFYQFWFLPEIPIPAKIEKKNFPSIMRWGKWTLIGSLTGRDNSLALQQDVDLYTISLNSNEQVTFEGLSDRFYWIQVAKGSFSIMGTIYEAGDGISITREDLFIIICKEEGSLFLLDLP